MIIQTALNEGGYSVWIDTAGIRAGQKWRTEIAHGIHVMIAYSLAGQTLLTRGSGLHKIIHCIPVIIILCMCVYVGLSTDNICDDSSCNQFPVLP